MMSIDDDYNRYIVVFRTGIKLKKHDTCIGRLKNELCKEKTSKMKKEKRKKKKSPHP